MASKGKKTTKTSTPSTVKAPRKKAVKKKTSGKKAVKKKTSGKKTVKRASKRSKRGSSRGSDVNGDVAGADELGEPQFDPLEELDDPKVDADGEPVSLTTSVLSGKRKATSTKKTSSAAALSRRDPFEAYMREVKRYPLLTREQELELSKKYVETQDPEIARQLVTANLRLVIKLAYDYRRAYKNMMDLIQEGNIGLMQAVKRYDPYRGVKLSSYSAWWIRAYMLRYILNNWRLVKLGTTQAQRKLFFNLNKQKAKLTAMGIEASPKVIAENLGVKEKEVIEMDRRMGSSEASLDAPLGDGDGRSVARIELMPSQDRATDETVASQQLGEMLNHHLDIFKGRLEGKELVIFTKRMVAEDPLTLQVLGDEFGVSRERVRQLEARMARKLREYLKAELGDAVEFGS